MTYEQIQNLDEYKELMKMGFEDTSTDTLKRRLNVRIQNEHLYPLQSVWHPVQGSLPPSPAEFGIYQNGYVRTLGAGTPSPIPSLKSGPLESLSQFNDKLGRTRSFLTGKFLKDSLGISKRAKQKEIGDMASWGHSVKAIWEEFPDSLTKWLGGESDTTQGLFLTAEGLEDLLAQKIQKAPGKWAMILKPHYKEETIKKAIALLPPEMSKTFQKDLNLAGDLKSLGL